MTVIENLCVGIVYMRLASPTRCNAECVLVECRIAEYENTSA